MRRAPAAVLTAFAVLIASACGGGPDGREVLRETAQRLDRIRGGDIDLRASITPREDGDAGRIGFALRGRVRLGDEGGLPVARLTYTQLSGNRSATATFVSDGQSAYAESGGRRIALPPARVEAVRAAGGALQREGLGEVRIDRWLEDPEGSDGEEIAGAETDKVEAELDAVRALRDLGQVAGELGSDAIPRLSAAAARRLDEAVEESSVEIQSGKDDRLLRSLRMVLEFAFDVPENLRGELGELVGARMELSLRIARPRTR